MCSCYSISPTPYQRHSNQTQNCVRAIHLKRPNKTIHGWYTHQRMSWNRLTQIYLPHPQNRATVLHASIKGRTFMDKMKKNSLTWNRQKSEIWPLTYAYTFTPNQIFNPDTWSSKESCNHVKITFYVTEAIPIFFIWYQDCCGIFSYYWMIWNSNL